MKVVRYGTLRQKIKNGSNVDVVPPRFKARCYAAGKVPCRRSRLRVNFLIPRAAVARDYLPKALEKAGARVDVVPAYQTVLPDNLERGRVSAMLAGGADCIAFTSPSTVENLAQLFDSKDLSYVLKGITVACIGDVTAGVAVMGYNESFPRNSRFPSRSGNAEYSTARRKTFV